MKKLTTIFCLILMSYALYSQDLVGQWKGTLEIQGRGLSLVFYVYKTNNQYEATMDSPDQNVSGIKVTATSFSYPNVKFEISSLATVFEGTMSDNNINGKWVQSGTALFLVLLKSVDSFDK